MRLVLVLFLAVILAIPALAVELFRYRGAAPDGSTLEYVFETDEQDVPQTATKEKVAEIAANFMTVFYHIQVGALETQELRTAPVPYWLVCFSDMVKGQRTNPRNVFRCRIARWQGGRTACRGAAVSPGIRQRIALAISRRLPKFPPRFLRRRRKRLRENLERVFYFGYRRTEGIVSGFVADIQVVVVSNGNSAPVVGLVNSWVLALPGFPGSLVLRMLSIYGVQESSNFGAIRRNQGL